MMAKLTAQLEGLASIINTRHPELPHTSTNLTIKEFCTRNRLSRSSYYKLQKTRQGPRFAKVGRSIRISIDAEGDWRRQMELDLSGEAGR
jgi:predicted DNA-binding transcriptional regulator AlpA